MHNKTNNKSISSLL